MHRDGVLKDNDPEENDDKFVHIGEDLPQCWREMACTLDACPVHVLCMVALAGRVLDGTGWKRAYHESRRAH